MKLKNGQFAIDYEGLIPVVVLEGPDEINRYLVQKIGMEGQYRQKKDNLILIDKLSFKIKKED